MRPLPRAAVWSAAIFGLIIRIWALRSPLGRYNSDDAVVGLMALRINAGDHFLFYWGQDYGGAFEPELTALAFKLFGANGLTLRFAPIALHGTSAVLLARIGTRLLDTGRGELAGLLWWIAPPVGVLWSIHAGGYYGALVAIGLGIALLCLRLRERPARREAIALGALVGLGIWTSPQIALLTAVPLVYLALSRATWRLAPYVAAPALVALGPWLGHQLEHDWVSLRTPDAVLRISYLDRVWVWFRAVPTMLGLVPPYRSNWIAPGAALAFAAIVLVLVIAVARTRPVPVLILVWAAAAPFWFALSPFATSPYVIRYLYPFLPIGALVVAIAFRHLAVACLALGVTAILTATTLAGTAGYARDHARFSYEVTPPDLDPLIAHLEHSGIDRVWADYWVAYRLTFATEERIIAEPIDPTRYGPYRGAVTRAESTTYVFPNCDADFGRNAFERHGLRYDENVVGDFTVFALDAPANPRALGMIVGLFRTFGCLQA